MNKLIESASEGLKNILAFCVIAAFLLFVGALGRADIYRQNLKGKK